MSIRIKTRKLSQKKQILQKERMCVGEYLLLRLESFGLTHLIKTNTLLSSNLQKLSRSFRKLEFLSLSSPEQAIDEAFAYSLKKGFAALFIKNDEIVDVLQTSSRSYCENCPILIIGISTSVHIFQTEKFQQIHSLQEKAFRTIMLESMLLDTPVSAPVKIDDIIETCITSKKPCYLEVPDPILLEKIPRHVPVQKMLLKSDPENLHEALRLTILLTKKAVHTALCIDSGSIYPTTTSSFLQIVKDIKATCYVTKRTKNAFCQLDPQLPTSKSEDLIFYFGFEGSFTQDGLDLLGMNSKHKIFSYFDRVIIDDIVFEEVFLEEYAVCAAKKLHKSVHP